MNSLFESATFKVSVANLEELPHSDLPEIAFAGRSNAGKSTAINCICRKSNLAFSSKSPGRTQLLNFFEISVKGEKPGQRIPTAYLVDLPGYGFAKASPSVRATWENLVGGYVTSREQLKGIVILMDARRPFMPADDFLLDFLSPREDLKLLFLLNKADQLKNSERVTTLRAAQKRAQEMGGNVTAQLFSGLKKEGVEELKLTLCKWLGIEVAAKMPSQLPE
ncbi:MAG: ribosome biogenesis GTP-binding protein YihA/YsxC [Burkholderiales bacterium]|nr:ribosome biogenesis GTP-binding protein YihA/YsxC [Burkholderiales bacterium]